jgi:hypothetical protein
MATVTSELGICINLCFPLPDKAFPLQAKDKMRAAQDEGYLRSF